MPRRGGWPVRRTVGDRSYQAVAADLISVSGHNRWRHQTPIEDRRSRGLGAENNGLRRGHALETLRGPHPGLRNASGCVHRHAEFVSDSAEGQPPPVVPPIAVGVVSCESGVVQKH